MAYENITKRAEQNVKQDDMLASKRFVIERKPDTIYFYELEEAVVLDVVMDENHPIYTGSLNLDVESWPPNINGSEPNPSEKDYSWIGRIRFRFLNSQINEEKSVLEWAYPLENTGIVEYPLMNEIVIVGKYMDKYFYTRKLNSTSTVNSNAMFSAERNAGQVESNINTFSSDGKYKGPESKMNFSGGDDYTGILGSYFKFNPKIRALKSYEGDTILQSRFGSSIRFGAYDSNRSNDNGFGEYADGGGNPMVLIRNRQAPVTLPQGNTGKGYTLEDINKDGSSIHMTSGKTRSKFAPEASFAGMINVTRAANVPQVFDGDQIVFNSDRLIFSSRAKEMLFYSKKMIGMTTDSILSLNSNNNTTITSKNGIITLNAKKIYLNFNTEGANDEPALLGRTTVLWMYTLCDWMLLNVNTQIQMLMAIISHFHMTKVGPTTPPMPPAMIMWAEQMQSLYASQISLTALRSQLSSLLSSRVFLGG